MRGLVVAAALLAPGIVYAQSSSQPVVETATISTPSEVSFLVMAKNGKSLAALCKDKQIRLWSLPQGQLLRTIDKRGRDVDLVLLSDDGRWILANDAGGSVTVWDSISANASFQTKLPRSVRVRAMPAGQNPSTFSHAAKYLALSAAGEAVQILEWPSGRALYRLAAPPGGSYAVAFSGDDSRIAAADTDGILRIYDSSTGKLVAQNEDLLGEAFAIDFSADGRQVVAGGADKAAIFVDAATGKLVRRLERLADVVAYLEISPDGKHLSAVLARAESMVLPAPVLVWDAASGKKIAEWTPPSVAFGTAWSEAGHWLVVTSTPAALHLWRVY